MIKSLARHALVHLHVDNTNLPASLRKDVRSAAVRLRFFRKTKLPNPFKVGEYNINYFHQEQLRYLFNEIFFEGCYLFHNENDHPLILDCGSNIGMSILFFKKLYPNARVVGFEPDPATFEKLKTNIEKNALKDVTLHQCALSNEAGTIDFYNNEKREGHLMMSVYKERLDGAKITVPTQKLSTFINEPVDLLKMDIEGAEEQVIPELAATGKLRMIKQIHLEYHHHINKRDDKLSSILRILEDKNFGYQIRAKTGASANPETFQDISIYAYQK